MIEKMKELRLNVTASAIISAIIGVLLLIYPTQSILAIGRIIAIVVILAGIAVIVAQIIEFGKNVMGITVGVILSIIGVWMFVRPDALLKIIPIAIGVILVIHGIQDLLMAFEGAKAGVERPWIAFVIAILNIILGFFCVANAFGFVKLAFQVIGVMLIFDGLTDLGIVHTVRKATGSVVDSTITKEEDIF